MKVILTIDNEGNEGLKVYSGIVIGHAWEI